MKVFVVLCLIGLAAAGHFPHPGHGYHGRRCSKELVKITAMKCKLDHDEECTTETKVVGDKVTYEKGECKNVEVCEPVHFVPRHVFKRAAEADADYGYAHPPCEKVMKEICKREPIKTPVEKEVEICTLTPKEVCEEVETTAAKLTCETIKGDPMEEEEMEEVEA